MKKKIICLFIALGFTTSVFAQDFLIEGKLAYFRPNAKALRAIYSQNWMNSQFEITTPLWRCLNLYGSVNYLSTSGHSTEDNKSTVRIVPISLGLKYRQPIKEKGKKMDLYFAGGMRYFFVKIKNNDEFVVRRITKQGLGGVAEVGTLIFLTQNFLLDLFADYSYKRFDFSTNKLVVEGHKLDVGGFSAGAGLGFCF